MAKMHSATGRRDTTAMYREMTDKAINVPRYGSIATRRAIKTAFVVRDNSFRYGHTCDRVLLVFVDNHDTPDYLAAIVLSLDNDKTLVLDVDNEGNVTSKRLLNLRTAKRLPRETMYALVGKSCALASIDPNWNQYNTRVYARNLSCYAPVA